ncbi:uncharacterized protein BJ212DRAFT_1339924 [Suillus subaureus]|uniref:Uncharacterized protein n=1 Tax=Suillus subaureus TaxID=48587 RepID=A0A9P7EFJ2_9AGAM|nr:uncharacterized protein BJ212DRAFT_1339924 [Suillus subaureus]KAG1820407.1 hypothetical protein BJ212DRAFT_1339924 [Suillus subaureus]
MIRTMALWEWRRWAVLSMLALSFGQCAILIRTGMTVQASWDHQPMACVVVRTNHILLNLNYAYTMSFDFVILVMTLFVLRKRFRHEDLAGLLCRDGLVYFLITSTCNTVPAVLAAFNLNDEMNVIAMVSCIAAFFVWLNSIFQVPAAAVSYVLCFILMVIFYNSTQSYCCLSCVYSPRCI